jgi:hypothetical protein
MPGPGTVLYALAMLALVLGFIAALGWLLRTYGARWGLAGSSSNNALHVSQRVALSAQHSLLDVREPGMRYLILIGPNHSTVVAQHTLKQNLKKKALP